MRFNSGAVGNWTYALRFNLFHAAVNRLAFQPPSAHYERHDWVMWPWGGSVTSPRFDLFNLDWVQAVDRSIQRIETLGVAHQPLDQGHRAPWPHGRGA